MSNITDGSIPPIEAGARVDSVTLVPDQPEPPLPEPIVLEGIGVSASTRIAALTAALDKLTSEAKGMFILLGRRKKKNPPHWRENNAICAAARVLAASDAELITARHEEQALARLLYSLLGHAVWDEGTGTVVLPSFTVGIHPSTKPQSAKDGVLMALALGEATRIAQIPVKNKPEDPEQTKHDK